MLFHRPQNTGNEVTINNLNICLTLKGRTL